MKTWQQFIAEANQHTPFLDEIRSAKTEEELQFAVLVYADWLEEQGDPFGEKLRELWANVSKKPLAIDGPWARDLDSMKKWFLTHIREKNLKPGQGKPLPSVEEVRKDLEAFGKRRDDVEEFSVSTINLQGHYGSLNYETLVFPEGSSIEVWGTRYETVEEAAKGHIIALMKVRQGAVPSFPRY